MVAVRQEGETASFRVHLQPKASRDAIVGEVDGVLRLRVTAPPVEGRANEACLRLLAKVLDLPVSRLRIVVGTHARVKTIRIVGTSADLLRTALCNLLEPPKL
ncbi:MAG: DUF167 domain-containing protein [candidate division NC10 bacterium]|nr:DUF167 domain-containing protein [candidate division NC10 bacterium]MDE2322647.1 DUF167 domain-containing protein [candidate division NC10 bacterium]MDE2485257.1 DUF167 domain-containing protein [candidate division NC10 bacterium]